MLKKINNNKLIKLTQICITILLLAQPVFDIIKTSRIHDIQIFGFSFFEIFNIILIFFLGVLAIIQSQTKKRLIRYFILVIIFFIYFVLHCYNMTIFNDEIYPNHTTNFLVEFYYLYKTFINPLILMMSLYYIGCDKDYIVKIIQIFSLIISITIITSNIFGFGYMSYGEENSKCLKSVFDWINFDNKYRFSFYELTCRGLFFSANQISSITFMIFPILLYSAYKNKKLFDYVSLICMIICMYILGTKVSTYGVLAVFSMFYLLYIFFVFYNRYMRNYVKLNNIIFITLIFIFSVCLFTISPRRYEMKFSNGDVSSIKLIEDSLSNNEVNSLRFTNEWKIIEQIKCYKMSNIQIEKFLSFFNEYSDYMGISPYIIKNYNPSRYPEFWCNYLQTSKSNDYRVLKTSILKDIYNNNDNKLDKYFGLGYNLNYIYTELDYSYQFYIYGLIGCIIFLSGYFIAIVFSIYRILKNKNKLFNFENVLLLSSPVIALLTANFSGHVLERTMPLLVLSILCSLTLLSSKTEY